MLGQNQPSVISIFWKAYSIPDTQKPCMLVSVQDIDLMIWYEDLLTWHDLKQVSAGFFGVGCQFIHLAALQWDAALHRPIVRNASRNLYWAIKSILITMHTWM